ncbi:YqzK family protein [Peribacillus sp. SCS-26]|uniref:YqzK family protein n=1 Tax=Paraperibacillus marinus TaxID=3115295 RepID=UPI003906CF43
MKYSVDLLFNTAKVFLLFVSFTVLFYFGMVWLNQEYENYHRYDEPKGTAVKVSGSVHSEGGRWMDRLLLFYKNGE